MPDYSDHGYVKKLLEEAQDADQDNRELAKQAHLFVSKIDGQWEPERWSACDGKPRYTFDMVSPIIDQIAGDIEQSDFDIQVKPAGKGATKELAELRDGMVRSIETLSNAQSVYAGAGRNCATCGYDVWMLTSDYVDDNSFDQDILIKPVHNSIDRVWFDVGAQERDMSDSKYGFLLSAIPKEEFERLWPEAGGCSVSDGTESDAYYDKAETVIIGHFYYQKLTPREIVKTNMGRVFEYDDDFKAIEDELAARGEAIEDRRTVNDSRFWVRKFDADGWLDEAEETPFSQIPLVPVYGNFKMLENKIIYHGAVQKLMDAQRVLNYSLSREIEEGALAPRKKLFMTTTQAKGHTDSLETMNTNSDPVQFYNADPDAPPPYQGGGAEINPGLRVISEGMQQIMGRSAGIFAAGMGDNPNAQSGVAIDKLQDKSNNITSKYFKALEIAVRQTGKLILDAIPIVYDVARQMRIVNQDGTIEVMELNQPVIDNETGKQVILNDLTQGKYDVTCTAGPSYNSRKQETVEGILKLAAIDPTIIQLGQDVLLNNISSPGIDDIAARSRRQRFNAGLIPLEQMTDEEKQEFARAQQNRQPDANMALAMAEQAKAEAAMQKNQIDLMTKQSDLAIKEQDLRLRASELSLKAQEQELAFMEKVAAQNLKQEDQQFRQMKDMFDMQQRAMMDNAELLNKEANTLKTLREAMGVDSIVGQNVDTYARQNVIVQGAQDLN